MSGVLEVFIAHSKGRRRATPARAKLVHLETFRAIYSHFFNTQFFAGKTRSGRHACARHTPARARPRPMSGGRTQLYLVGFTLLGGALGFYVEERVESYYKQRRFEAFEAACERRRGDLGGDRGTTTPPQR